MELGALVCRPRAPLCGQCPVRIECAARVPENLPVKRARAEVTRLTERRGFITDGARLFLRQSTERWKGMWILPVVEDSGAPDHVEIYPITRYRVRMEVRRLPLPEGSDLRGFSVDELPALPIPSPHRRAIRALAGIGATRHR
jgi:A/G-specific adenine glycosylase